jgi:hypothetical protein
MSELIFPQEGIYNDVPIDVYHQDRSIISSTGLKKAKISSRDFAWYLAHGSEKSVTFDMGNVFEVMLLDKINGTNEAEKCTTIFDPSQRPEQDKGITSKKNQDWKNSIFNSDKYVLPLEGAESLETVNHMIEAVMAEPVIVKLLNQVQYQQSFVWRDKETGVLCKSRPDFSLGNKRVLVDLKSTKNGSPKDFAKECVNYDYFLQAIMQMEGVLQSGFMEEVDEYFWIAVQKTEPYNACLYRFQKQDWAMIRAEYRYYLERCARTIADLVENGNNIYKIHGYSENADNKFGIVDIELPLYYSR